MIFFKKNKIIKIGASFILFLGAIGLLAYFINKIVLYKKKEHYFVPKISKLKVSGELKNEEESEYSEININSYKTVCLFSDFEDYKKSFTPLENTNHIFSGAMPLSSFIQQNISESLQAKLEINNSGSLLYYLNETVIWTSQYPRSLRKSNVIKLLEQLSFNAPIDEWKNISQTSSGNAIFHIFPLSITSLDSAKNKDKGEESNSKRKLAWSLFSGWDAYGLLPLENYNTKDDGKSHTINQKKSKEVFLPVPLLQNFACKVILMSPSRNHRLCFIDNGDLAVFKTGSEKDNNEVFSVNLVWSLMQSSCESIH